MGVQSGVVELPPGTHELRRPLRWGVEAQGLVIRGHRAGTVLKAAPGFQGRALIEFSGSVNVRIENLTLEGDPAALEQPQELPPYDVALASHIRGNGILAEFTRRLTISRVRLRHIAGFAIVVRAAEDVRILEVTVENSGSRNPRGRNNTTGGILLEEATRNFLVRGCRLQNVLGNGIWTHSRLESGRNRDGRIENNWFERIGRDAIQVGHATRVLVQANRGRLIGYPVEVVDVEGGGTPVALDTAGNVDHSLYRGNVFEEVNGKCIDLDGFHHGAVRENRCRNRGQASDYPWGHYGIVMNHTDPQVEPAFVRIERNEIDGARYGGIFLVGHGHQVRHNRLRRLNLAGCPESGAQFGCDAFPGWPGLLSSGIYLASGWARPAPAVHNLVEGNSIEGHGMERGCIGFAPAVDEAANLLRNNVCVESRQK